MADLGDGCLSPLDRLEQKENSQTRKLGRRDGRETNGS
jgi:hypothetical protein